MSELLDESYLTWLYGQVSSVRTKSPTRTHWGLLRQLYTTEFVWFVPNDDNRAEDGKELRKEFFLDESIFEVDPDWIDLECSVLEMLVALSRRLSFEAEGETRWWFWHLLENLELTHYNDKEYDNQDYINKAIDRLLNRRYKKDGLGGLFPLDYAGEDQRKVELWYQLASYVIEREEG